MLCSLPRCLSVAAISYGCIGFSKSSTRTARASGLLSLWGDFITRLRIYANGYTDTNIRPRASGPTVAIVFDRVRYARARSRSRDGGGSPLGLAPCKLACGFNHHFGVVALYVVSAVDYADMIRRRKIGRYFILES